MESKLRLETWIGDAAESGHLKTEHSEARKAEMLAIEQLVSPAQIDYFSKEIADDRSIWQRALS